MSAQIWFCKYKVQIIILHVYHLSIHVHVTYIHTRARDGAKLATKAVGLAELAEADIPPFK